jgi:DNA-directed RNA polymerase specialized sigma24 family protein
MLMSCCKDRDKPVRRPAGTPKRRPTRRQFPAWVTAALQALAALPVLYHGRWLLTADAVNAALARAWAVALAEPGTFTSPRHLSNWVRLAAFRLMIDEFRRDGGGRRRTFSFHDLGELRDARSPEDRAGRWTAEDRAAVWECLCDLPDLERAILEGHYYDGLTDVEIGCQVFQEPPSASLGLRVWRRRQKAEALLRQALQQRGVGTDG